MRYITVFNLARQLTAGEVESLYCWLDTTQVTIIDRCKFYDRSQKLRDQLNIVGIREDDAVIVPNIAGAKLIAMGKFEELGMKMNNIICLEELS